MKQKWAIEASGAWEVVNIDILPRHTRKHKELHAFKRKFPSVVAVRPPVGVTVSRAIRFLCGKNGCTRTLMPHQAYKLKTHLCVEHRCGFVFNEKIPTAALRAVSHRIVAVKRRPGGGPVQFLAQCSTRNCKRLANARTPVKSGGTIKFFCPYCSKKYLVCGRYTSSKMLYTNRDIVVGWHEYVSKKGTLVSVPLCQCEHRGCSRKIFLGKRLQMRGARKPFYCRDCSQAVRRHEPFLTAYSQLKRNCFQRRIECKLTFKQFKKLRLNHKNCFYCGVLIRQVDYKKPGRMPAGVNTTFLDRVNNDLGYSLRNVVVCCAPCNMIKWRFLTPEAMAVLGAAMHGNASKAANLVRQHRVELRSWYKSIQERPIHNQFNRKMRSTV